MSAQLPILQILVPFIGALVCVALKPRLVARTWAVGVAWTCLIIAGTLLHRVLQYGPISYELGGFAPPWGIEYRIDIANAYVLLIVSAIASVVVPFGPGSGAAAIPRGREHLFYGLILLCLSGLLGMAITGDIFNVFVFLEISSLSAYALIGLGPGRHAPRAAFSYLLMGTIAGTFFLLGVGMMYAMTGSLNMVDLSHRLAMVHDTRTMALAVALVVVGLSIKLAVFPLHQWLPNAYTYAPAAVSAFIAATATKVIYYVLIRVIFTIFGAAIVFETYKVHYLLVPLSITAMFLCSLAAIYQTNVKRLLAYSSVAQIGYMTLGLSYNSVTGLSAGLIHLFNHALMKGGLFLVVGCVVFRTNSASISDFRGLGRKMPLTMAAFVVGGLSMIGVPGTVGFISKWYLVLGALEKGWYPVAVMIMLSSLLALVYIWRIIEAAYFKKPENDAPVKDAPLSMLIPTWILIGATLYFGFSTDLTVGVATDAARQLIGGAP